MTAQSTVLMNFLFRHVHFKVATFPSVSVLCTFRNWHLDEAFLVWVLSSINLFTRNSEMMERRHQFSKMMVYQFSKMMVYQFSKMMVSDNG